ncbi:MAG: tRNA pseudouridine(55) synthase TruB [Christensenellaceae bacterium]|jgi:tRNA pseudouridine55 synthase|nr:tRNA pseudouridine(55) synthase TruB [Christensenellaceae bacterium]
MLSGFIVLNKRRGISSQKALSEVKYHLKRKGLCVEKIGHMGTLDPDADGVLVIALGRATRLFDYHLTEKKSYYSEFLFGIKTDTLDATGKILELSNKIVTRNEIIQVLPSFTRSYNQIPPDFSAKSINGVKAYKLARDSVKFELNSKTITVYSFDLLDKVFDTKNIYAFEIVCSPGTYVRSLARDMGEALNTFAITRCITRLASGRFKLVDSITIDEFVNSPDPLEHIITLDKYVQSAFETFKITQDSEKKILNGSPARFSVLPDSNCFALYNNQQLIGLAMKDLNNYVKITTWLI